MFTSTLLAILFVVAIVQGVWISRLNRKLKSVQSVLPAAQEDFEKKLDQRIFGQIVSPPCYRLPAADVNLPPEINEERLIFLRALARVLYEKEPKSGSGMSSVMASIKWPPFTMFKRQGEIWIRTSKGPLKLIHKNGIVADPPVSCLWHDMMGPVFWIASAEDVREALELKGLI